MTQLSMGRSLIKGILETVRQLHEGGDINSEVWVENLNTVRSKIQV